MSESKPNNNATTGGLGIGAGFILFVVFLILKLCKVIDWSWWWITAPLWIPVGLVIAIFILVGIPIVIIKMTNK